MDRLHSLITTSAKPSPQPLGKESVSGVIMRVSEALLAVRQGTSSHVLPLSVWLDSRARLALRYQ